MSPRGGILATCGAIGLGVGAIGGIAIGLGVGEDAGLEGVFKVTLTETGPSVEDADALSALTAPPEVETEVDALARVLCIRTRPWDGVKHNKTIHNIANFMLGLVFQTGEKLEEVLI